MKYEMKHTGFARRAGMVALAVVMGACLSTGCKKKKPEKIDLGSIHTSEAETQAPETTETASTQAESTTAATEAAKKISAKINTYTSGKVSIQYPSVENLEDQEKTAAIDKLMKDNALSFIAAKGLNEAEDAVSIQCDVLSADRNRITVTYSGTVQKKGEADATAVFFSNTVDVKEAKDLGFDKFADPYTMAGYVLSGDCIFPFASADQTQALMSWKNKKSLDEYTKLFNQADFPFTGEFPQSFSYEQEGDIYFSIPMSHELGDYAIVVYMPDNK